MKIIACIYPFSSMHTHMIICVPHPIMIKKALSTQINLPQRYLFKASNLVCGMVFTMHILPLYISIFESLRGSPNQTKPLWDSHQQHLTVTHMGDPQRWTSRGTEARKSSSDTQRCTLRVAAGPSPLSNLQTKWALSLCFPKEEKLARL